MQAQQSPDAPPTGLPMQAAAAGSDALPPPRRAVAHDGAAGTAASSASSSGAAAVPRVRRRNRMITSCLECRRRKLKCDKSHPCANCTKAARDCLFLAPALDTAAQLKLTEIKEKMGSLERVLEQDVARSGRRDPTIGGSAAHSSPVAEEIDFAPVPDDERDLEPSPMSVIDAVYEDDADNDLADLGISFGRLRLTERLGGFFRPKMSEEITVSLTDTRSGGNGTADAAQPNPPGYFPRPDNFMAPGPTYIPPSSSFFFSSGNQGTSLIDFLPSTNAAHYLMTQYWLAVHPVARVVHRPSFERRYGTFWQDIQQGIEPVGSLQAIVFAAMFSAVVSMSEDMVMRDFGAVKRTLVENFQQGAETALARANLLRTTKVETMQAFVIYMIPMCRAEVSRSHSALVGTAVRLAECMGLHRDGTAYGIGPVETHVRRLVWYQLCFLDIRTCESQGPRPSIREGEFDTRIPLNLDDVGFGKSLAPKTSASHWTEMTFPIIRMECNEMMREIWVDRPRLEKKQMSLTALLGKIENFKRITLEKYTPLFDDSVPIKYLTRLVMNILIARMYIMVLHRYHSSVHVRIPDRLRQIILTNGTEHLEQAMILETDPRLSPWVWMVGAYQQWHTAFLLLSEVFAYPLRKEADRIWRIVDFVFEPPRHLSRQEKARVIITEIRDRLSIYKDVRKMRAPTSMLKRIGQAPPRSVNDGILPPDAGQSSAERPLIFPANNMEVVAHPSHPSHPSHPPPPSLESGSSGATGSRSSQSEPPDVHFADELMVDIDWDEWDKLFPPEINTGELDLPTQQAEPGAGFPYPARFVMTKR